MSEHLGAALRNATIATIVVLLLASPWPAGAEASDLPDAETMLDQHAEAIGGKALSTIDNSFSRGTLELVGMGISGDLTLYVARPSESSLRFEAGALGTIRSGTSGGVAWEVSDLQGPRLLEGSEKVIALRSAMLDAEVRWRELYSEATTTGIADVDGRRCYTVEMVPKEGKAETWYIDAESKLLLKMTMTMVHAMGEIPVEMLFDDYREVEGVKVAFRITNKVLTQEMLTVLASVEYNVELPDGVFGLPDEIRALLLQQEAVESARAKEEAALETD